jgi:hypothetical protein
VAQQKGLQKVRLLVFTFETSHSSFSFVFWLFCDALSGDFGMGEEKWGVTGEKKTWRFAHAVLLVRSCNTILCVPGQFFFSFSVLLLSIFCHNLGFIDQEALHCCSRPQHVSSFLQREWSF